MKKKRNLKTLADLHARRMELQQELDFQGARFISASKTGIVQLGMSWGLGLAERRIAGKLFHNLGIAGNLTRLFKNIFRKK